MLIPQEKLAAVKAVMSSESGYGRNSPNNEKAELADDPWKGLLGDEERVVRKKLLFSRSPCIIAWSAIWPEITMGGTY